MKKLILFFFLILNYDTIQSQNLVMNPSFEDSIPCATYPGPPQLQCDHWFMATGGSVDFYTNVCSNTFYGVPNNAFGYQIPRTGTTYCGLSTFGPISSANNREYLEGQLIDTLKQGHSYCVSFYVVNTNNGIYYTPEIAAYLSTDSVFDQSFGGTLSLIPQIENTNGFIYDTLNWVQVNGTFVAQGGEKYITIGNFKDDVNTAIDSNSNTDQFFAFAYFYIDDVTVTDCTVGINNINSANTQSKLYPNPTKQTQVYYTSSLATNQTGNLQVMDMLGNIMATYTLNSGSNKITINTSAYAKGVYVVKVNVAGMAGESLKLVVQ